MHAVSVIVFMYEFYFLYYTNNNFSLHITAEYVYQYTVGVSQYTGDV